MKKLHLFYFTIFSVFFISCDSIRTATFDQYSYQKATEIKVETNQLLDNAIYPYEDYEGDIKDLKSELDKIIEYEKNKPYNDISLKMWKILSDEERNLLAGFLRRWEEEEQMSRVFVDEAKSQILEAIDIIIKYESNKDQESKDDLMNLIMSN